MGKSLPYFCVRNSLEYCYILKKLSSDMGGGGLFLLDIFQNERGFFVCVRIAAFIMLLQWRSGFVYRLKRYFFFSRSVRSKIRFFQCWFLFIFLHLKRSILGIKDQTQMLIKDIELIGIFLTSFSDHLKLGSVCFFYHFVNLLLYGKSIFTHKTLEYL